MRRTEVYQVRLDVHEKKQAFAVFKQLGISPAQAIRLFFRQVVVTRSIPFAIEQGQHEPLDSVRKSSKKNGGASEMSHLTDQDIFDQLNALLQDNALLSDKPKDSHNTQDSQKAQDSHPLPEPHLPKQE